MLPPLSFIYDRQAQRLEILSQFEAAPYAHRTVGLSAQAGEAFFERILVCACDGWYPRLAVYDRAERSLTDQLGRVS